MKEQWKVIAIIMLLILVVVFALQNTNVVGIDFFFTQFEVSLVLVVLFSILVGVIIGMIASMSAIQSNRKKNKELEKQLSKEKHNHSNTAIEKDATIAELRSKIEEQERVSRNTISVEAEEKPELNEDVATDTTEEV
ncbi:LapA family protein [Ruoffia tabacinasalis]|uniref:LapA family protein n=1 Tax=Ruoffia tabacinasalis TaxID=87458 RepID=UPI003F9E6012